MVPRGLSKHKVGQSDIIYKSIYPTGPVPPSSMASPKSTNKASPLGPLYPTGLWSFMEWPGIWHIS